ncbi:type IV secretory system conjugative DNA transfer family protein [Agromyces humi]|uniref:type IV secretory system conjugative DNA transfer family protein n=1 Tax=Agromyces humi TaxID=1766800 RepID=UPI00135740A6|nr:type IV secretory system conjugative DNA transfer family protein [Agromyces humi]
MTKHDSPLRVYKLSRSGSFDPNPMTFIQTAGVFASTVVPGTTLLTTRDENGLAHFLIVPATHSAGKSAMHLAAAVAARAEEVDELPPLADAAQVAWLTTERTPSLVSRDTQQGADPAAVSRALSIAMRPGQWVAATLRRPTAKERKWQLAWLSAQLGTNNPQYHSRRSDALVATFYAGAETTAEAGTLLREVGAAMPGFDIGTDVATSSRSGDAKPWIKGAFALGAAGGVLAFGGAELAHLPALTQVTLFAAAAASAVISGGLRSGHIPGRHSRFRAALHDGRLPAPAGLSVAPQKARKESEDKDGNKIPARDPGYGFPQNAFLVGQEIPVSLVAPHAGSASGEQSTAVRAAPPMMNQIIGPRIGVSLANWVALSAKDLWQGVMFLGVPGSGKSQALRSVWTWMCLERAKPSGRDGFPGDKNVLVALETKGQGAEQYRRQAEAVGDVVGVCDLSDGSTPAIDMFPRVGSLEHQARTITNAMKYVWGETSIGSHSFNMLTRVFCGALIVTPAIVANAAGVRSGASPFYYANILLGGFGDELAVALATAIKSEAARTNATEDDDLGFAWLQLSTLYGNGVTPANRKSATEAPRNKAAALLTAEGWWSRTSKVSWDDILEHGWAVIVNVGSSKGGELVDKQLKEDMSAMLMYSLYDAIQRNCMDWDEQGRHVSIFSDELTEIAGNSPEIVEWIKDKGRSYGTIPVFATQRASQLVPQVRESVLGFGTVLAYTQDVAQVMSQIVADLSADGSHWEIADVANLPRYEAIVRTRVNGTRQPAFTMKLADFESDMSGYERVQTVADAEVPA